MPFRAMRSQRPYRARFKNVAALFTSGSWLKILPLALLALLVGGALVWLIVRLPAFRLSIWFFVWFSLCSYVYCVLGLFFPKRVNSMLLLFICYFLNRALEWILNSGEGLRLAVRRPAHDGKAVKCGFAFASRFRLFRARIEVHQCESLRYWIWQSAKKCAAAQGAPERSKEMDENLRWEKLEDKIIRKDRYIDFREARYRLPNGTEIAPFYHYSGRDFVVIAAKDTEGKYICVRQYRVGIDAVTTEFPAGGIERGESALEAAKRELLEETGAVAERWTELGSFFAKSDHGHEPRALLSRGGLPRGSAQDSTRVSVWSM